MFCQVCQETYSSPSVGGPGICPSCDCGIPPRQKKLARESAELRGEIIALHLAVAYWKAKAEGHEPTGFTPQMLAIAKAEKWPAESSDAP